MPINVFGNSSSSHDNGKKIHTSLIVQKPFLRSNYIEANIEENIEMINQCRIKKLPDPISIQETASKNFVDDKFIDPSIKKSNNPHPDIDLIYKKIINVRLLEVNHWLDYGDQLTSELYIDNAIRNNVDESTLLR